MVKVTVELEVRSESDANDFGKLVQEWSTAHGANGTLRIDEGTACPECGAPMVHSAELQALVCHHPEG